jgi:hypothetical protein
VLIPQIVTIEIYNILYNIIIYMHFIINEQLLAYGSYSTYICMLPRGIDEAQWSRPDEAGSDHPSIEERRGIQTMKAIDAFSALLGKETKKETNLSQLGGTTQRKRLWW